MPRLDGLRAVPVIGVFIEHWKHRRFSSSNQFRFLFDRMRERLDLFGCFRAREQDPMRAHRPNEQGIWPGPALAEFSSIFPDAFIQAAKQRIEEI